MNGDNNKKKKIAIIAVSSLFLVAMVIAVTVGVTTSRSKGGGTKSNDGQTTTSTKAIQAICQPTDYKETCQKSLESAGGNSTEPKELIKAGFKVAMDKLHEVIKNSTTLQELAKDPGANQALENCKELLDYAIGDLAASFDKLGPFDISKIDAYAEDLKIWLSAAMTYEQTCLDGFQNTTGDAGEKMKRLLNSTQELTSNGLAMVSEITSVLGSFNVKQSQRRLLAAGAGGGTKKDTPKVIPVWIDKRAMDVSRATPQSLRPDVTVAKDGSGQVKSIGEAVKQIPKNNADKTFVIYVKEGVYNEYVLIDKFMTNVMMIGDGPTKTKVTGNKNYADGTKTFQTATVAVVGDYFVAKDMGFENSAGAKGHQAVALRVQSDLSIFYNCQMDGYQDTLYTQTHRQFYRDCTISGTIDFIFGDAAVVFQNCKMIVRKPMDNQACMVTAQGRMDRRQPTAMVLQNCTISGDPEYIPVKDKSKAYLGRPWKALARTIVMQSQIDDIITPEGWMEWTGSTNHKSCWFGEYGNRGPGSDMTRRVTWSGIKKLTPEHAVDFTAGKLMEGDRWIKPSGVPYVAGMVSV
ncbi:putative pectinesterase/pectinesterase inhibitor 28 [Prunus yedoensis var. nudiflora]|uniref:Pectinesterase n=1 Tax=Prunus yedoensis var. nudiflora TaxID=2094558 RepID=A0A314YVQ9_PRUYE|nr:putative pectinesterase/pectinesterase inhibitor 28 [Prunus yedoensis var. nudiflora]